MVNNTFFAQLPITVVADVLRMVDRDTGFIECFKHVLGAQLTTRVHEHKICAELGALQFSVAALQAKLEEKHDE